MHFSSRYTGVKTCPWSDSITCTLLSVCSVFRPWLSFVCRSIMVFLLQAVRMCFNTTMQRFGAKCWFRSMCSLGPKPLGVQRAVHLSKRFPPFHLSLKHRTIKLKAWLLPNFSRAVQKLALFVSAPTAVEGSHVTARLSCWRMLTLEHF